MQEITSRDNERVKYAVKLSASAALRAADGLFMAEGPKLCLDLAQSLKTHSVFATAAALNAWPQAAELNTELYLISEPVAQKLSGTKSPQGLFALFELPRAGFDALQPQAGLLLCEDIQDPANVGTMLRTAAGLGFGGAVLTPACADPFGPKALRASMGAAARLPVVCGLPLAQALGKLQAQGVHLYATSAAGATPLNKVSAKRPFALLVGNEGAGLSDEALSAAGERIAIPMHRGVESLNAAAAAAIIMAYLVG